MCDSLSLSTMYLSHGRATKAPAILGDFIIFFIVLVCDLVQSFESVYVFDTYQLQVSCQSLRCLRPHSFLLLKLEL